MKPKIRRQLFSWSVFVLVISLFSGLFFVFLKRPQSFEVRGTEEALKDKPSAEIQNQTSPLSGLSCDNYQQRPIAVMLSSDSEARPLSSLTSADLIIEMPVVLGGATRLMAIYICDLPDEIGSVRSARKDFIVLARGFDAIFAHWGGSHFALDELKKGVINNIDALPNPFGAFYRKPLIAQPHNGFTSGEQILNAAQNLGYRLNSELEAFPHQLAETRNQEAKPATLTVGYPGEFIVHYDYDSQSNKYLRWRGNKKEIDRNNLQQVAVSVVVVMRAQDEPLEGQYNHVIIEGQGDCQVYQNGRIEQCIWQKDKSNPTSRLRFLDLTGQEIKFAPGQIWMEIIEPDKPVSWLEK